MEHATGWSARCSTPGFPAPACRPALAPVGPCPGGPGRPGRFPDPGLPAPRRGYPASRPTRPRPGQQALSGFPTDTPLRPPGRRCSTPLTDEDRHDRPQSTTDPGLAALKTAMDALLAVIVAEDGKPRAPELGPKFKLVPLRDIVMVTPLQADVSDLVRSPVSSACRQAVGRIGKLVHAITGSVAGMAEVAERVAGMDPPKHGHRLSIIGGAWNGIGSGDDRWWS